MATRRPHDVGRGARRARNCRPIPRKVGRVAQGRHDHAEARARHDRDNQDWFWVKYGKGGSIDKDPKGTLLAGRVAKGMKRGCISCHSQAGGDDYLFSNDQ